MSPVGGIDGPGKELASRLTNTESLGGREAERAPRAERVGSMRKRPETSGISSCWEET